MPIDEQKRFDTDQPLDQFVQNAHENAKPILRALINAQLRHKLFNPLSPVLVAVSGGADSLCLLHALHQLAPFWQLSLHVAHLDHNLRPDSGQDAAFVDTFVAPLGIPFHAEGIEVRLIFDNVMKAGGIEAIARDLRYEFLRRVAKNIHNQSGQAVTVATAHHQDDQAETILLHLLQGSGLQGLSGMAWVGKLPDAKRPAIRLVRPLLSVNRADIHAYLQAYGVEWREDSSNSDEQYLRNHLRHTILPMLATINPNIHATLARTADLLSAEAEHANQRDHAALVATAKTYTHQTRIVLDLFHLAQLGLATQRGVLRQAMLDLGVDVREMGMDGLDALLQRILDAQQTQSTSGPHPLLAGWAWTILRTNALGQASNHQPNTDASLSLSLHRSHELPAEPTYPHMGAPLPTPLPLPTTGTIVHNQWQLHSVLLGAGELPHDWRSRDHMWRFFGDANSISYDGPLRLETFRAGMTIAPLGMNGHERAVGDIFTDRKIPPAMRAGWPVITNHNGTVIWLCGLVVSHHVRLLPHSDQVRHLIWQPAANSLEDALITT